MNISANGLVDIPDDISNQKKRSIRLKNAKTRGTHSKEIWLSLVSICKRSCVKCGTNEYKVEKDHILPLYQGGCDCIHNIQPLCARCNASKGPESIDYRPSFWKEIL